MKLLPLLFLIFVFVHSQAQDNRFHLQGQVIDSHLTGIGDVYILNYRNLDKAVTRQNGVFDMWVLPGDSLMISHVSFTRKVVRVFDLMKNPIVKIEQDTVNILQVDVSPEQKTDMDRAQENLEFISEMKVPGYVKIKPEPNPVNQTVTEHNKVLRSEATSLSILRFSPSGTIGAAKEKIKKRKNGNQYSSKKRYKKNYPDESE